MISTFFTFASVGLLLMLCAHEILRHRADAGEAIAAGRKTLARRLGIAFLAIPVVLLINYWPKTSNLWVNFGLLAAVLISLLLILFMTLRDLHETSLAVVREHQRLQEEAERHFEAALGPRNGDKGGKKARRS